MQNTLFNVTIYETVMLGTEIRFNDIKVRYFDGIELFAK